MQILADQEFQDAGYDQLVQRSTKFNRFGRDQSIHLIREIAALYLRHRHHWLEFQLAHGIILKPVRGPTARSVFHPICRHLIGLHDGGDTMGLASVWAAVLDMWAEADIPPEGMPAWIASQGGLRAIYDADQAGLFVNHPPNDDVYTSRQLARRIVEHVAPTGSCLDCCLGGGAFYDALPEPRFWCERELGRDFLEWTRPVRWIITNPPWSAKAYREIARHAYEIADNVVFLARWHTGTATYARHRDWLRAGHGWRGTVVVSWKDAAFLDRQDAEKTEGFILAVFHWSRGWTGGMTITYWI